MRCSSMGLVRAAQVHMLQLRGPRLTLCLLEQSAWQRRGQHHQPPCMHTEIHPSASQGVGLDNFQRHSHSNRYSCNHICCHRRTPAGSHVLAQCKELEATGRHVAEELAAASLQHQRLQRGFRFLPCLCPEETYHIQIARCMRGIGLVAGASADFLLRELLNVAAGYQRDGGGGSVQQHGPLHQELLHVPPPRHTAVVQVRLPTTCLQCKPMPSLQVSLCLHLHTLTCVCLYQGTSALA
jgi:hypothetical protein